MSIYCTTFGLGFEHSPRCKRVRKLRANVYEQDDSKPCTCGSAPIKYKHSGVLPSDKDERDGWVSLAAIPSHITRNGRDDRPEGGKWYPWLRASVNDADVVLTRKQAKELRDSLTLWLKRSEVK